MYFSSIQNNTYSSVLYKHRLFHAFKIRDLILQFFREIDFTKKELNYSIALDSASILGGNEVMVAQLLNEQHNKIYDNDERLILDWALNAVWPKKAIDDFYKIELDMISQKQFTSLLPPMIQRDLARK